MPEIVISSKLIGKPDISGWSQVYEYRSADNLKLPGDLYILLSVANRAEARNVTEIGKNLSFKLQEAYYHSSDTKPLSALKNAVRIALTTSGDDHTPSITALVINKHNVYGVVYGRMSVALFRNENLTILLKGEEEQLHSLTGNLLVDDILFAGTYAFFDFFPKGVLKAALISGSVDTITEILAPKIHTKGNAGIIGVLLLKSAVIETVPEHQTSTYLPELPQYKKPAAPHLQNPFVKFKEKIFLNRLLSIFIKEIQIRKTSDEIDKLNKRKRYSAFVGIILLITLTLSTFIGTKQKAAREEKALLDTKIQEADHLLSESLQLIPLDNVQSKQLFLQSRDLVHELSDKGINDPKIEDLQRRLYENEGKVLGERTVTPQLFVDLSLLSSGLLGESMVTSDKTIYILDRTGKKVASVSMQTKRSQIVAGPQQIVNVNSIFVYGGQVYIVDDSGAYKIDNSQTRVINADWKGNALAAAYAGNVYVVKRDNKTIMKHLGTAAGFGVEQQWLTNSPDDLLADAQSLSIDGSLWILTSSGQILKYNQGNRYRFIITGMTSELNQPKTIYTAEGLKNLYILDQNNSRIVVIDKTGKFIMEYSSDMIKKATGIAADEDQKKIFILAGDKLMYIEGGE